MATVPSPEQSARKILKLFVEHFEARAGKVLRLSNFNSVIYDYDIKASDFNDGLQYALEKEWIEHSQGQSYILTQAGFDEA
ncbi:MULTISPECIES: hypothetical protein [Stenotrophomonas maltophilia group]|uniref:hypothetical protein n=1 Tax=Stenotrophomonas maltophilia group TaxID=995085 RepID=UPI00036C4CF8|nr:MULTISPECIES: hypothetical protein [Stenotrophomonas maltophilia group]QGL98791.1 hypothetical protein FEO90_19105 [Stenotrophomonas maltophilia]